MSPDQLHLAGAKILVVDDVAANRNLLSQTLESAGYTVSAAPTGEVALEIAGLDVPDLVLLDIILPGLDGLEVCRRLKTGERTRACPVIFITAKDEPASVLEGFRAGGVDYVTKPFQTDEVLARVETHLRISRLSQALAQKNTELATANERLQSEMDRRHLAEDARRAADEQLSVYASREAEHWGIAGFVGKSPTLRRILDVVRRLQTVSGATSVLITGESGEAEISPEHLHLLHPMHGSEPGAAAGPVHPDSVAGEGRQLDCPALSDEERILAYVSRHGTINNTECRQLLSVGMHRAWYLLHKMHEGGRLIQESGRRWAQYRCPNPEGHSVREPLQDHHRLRRHLEP